MEKGLVLLHMNYSAVMNLKGYFTWLDEPPVQAHCAAGLCQRLRLHSTVSQDETKRG